MMIVKLGEYLNFNLLSFDIIDVIFAIVYVQLNPKFSMAKSNAAIPNTNKKIAGDELDG